MWQAKTQESNGTAPKASRVRRRKAFMARVTARTPSSSSSNPQAVPLSIPGAKPPGWPLRLPPFQLELEGTRLPQKRWLRKPKLMHLRRLRRRMATTCTFAWAGKGGPSGYRANRDGAALCFSERWAAKCYLSPSTSSSAATGTRVAAVSCRSGHHFVRACLGLAPWRVWRYKRRCGGDRTIFGSADAASRGASCGSRWVRGC